MKMWEIIFLHNDIKTPLFNQLTRSTDTHHHQTLHFPDKKARLCQRLALALQIVIYPYA